MKEELKELFDYLRSLGFEGEQLEADIIRGIEVGLPFFFVNHRVHFGEELMDFELQINVPSEGSLPFLESYQAVFRSAVEIEHVHYGSIYTSELEEQMKQIDWQAFFKTGVRRTAIDPEKDMIMNIMRQLDILDRSKDFTVNAIREELIYKYWPKDIVELHSHSPVKLEDDFERSFHSGISSIPNINLAYYKSSGRFDELFESLEKMELEECAGVDLYRRLESALSENPDHFEIKFYKNGYDGVMDYSISVHKDGFKLKPESCAVSFISHLDIQHGYFNGIDSAALEKVMRSIDWYTDYELFHYTEDSEDPQFFPQVSDVKEHLYLLGQDKKGAEVADLLRLKYWIGAKFFEDMIPQAAWDELDQREKRTMQFPLEYTAEQMYNLMCDRAILQKSTVDYNYIEESKWIRLVTEGEGIPQIRTITDFPEQELRKQLHMVPFEPDFYSIEEALICGELVSAKIQGGKDVYVMTNPDNAVIELYTHDMKPIPFNFKLDPDWSFVPSNTSKKRNESKKQKSTNKKRKGL